MALPRKDWIMNQYILTLITFIPLAGALVILFMPKEKVSSIKMLGVITTFICLVFGTVLLINFNPNNPAMQFEQKLSWIPQLNIYYYMGADGISVPMLFLTVLISFLACLASWGIDLRVKEYFVLYLLLETGMVGAFSALDLFLFYVFWELMLVPMYFLIGIWGGPRKEYAAIKFFLYTLTGSVFILLGILALYFKSEPHTFNMLELVSQGNLFGARFQWLVFLALFLGFAIKVPVFPFHTWLPDAHVEAPTPISVILAAVLLKFGAYGFYRISYPILPDAAHRFVPWMALLAVIGIIYGAFVAMAQKDIKKMVAYSSVSHMGFVLLGLAAFTLTGFNGGYFQMFSHGILTGGLFLLVGVLYDRTHTRDLDSFGGLSSKVPRYAFVLTIISLGSLGLPGLSGFVSEFMVFFGAWTVLKAHTIISVMGIVITAGYMLYMLQRVLLGPLNEKWKDIPEMNARELITLIPLVIITIVIGVYPSVLLRLINPTMTDLIVKVGGIMR